MFLLDKAEVNYRQLIDPECHLGTDQYLRLKDLIFAENDNRMRTHEKGNYGT